MIAIGIDTGKNTGIAVWDSTLGYFRALATVPLYEALEMVTEWVAVAKVKGLPVAVFIEDARQRRWIPREMSLKEAKGRAQGAGSVKRDAVIWEEFLKGKKIPYKMVAPKDNSTKMSADLFARATGFAGRCSNHARDAAMLVWNKSETYLKSAQVQ